MKTIRVKFVGLGEDFDPERSHLCRLLKRYYCVEISENPDYVICGCFGKPYEYCKYPQVRIMYSGENYIPDFNLIDYGIATYPMEFSDRYYCYPFFIDPYGRCKSLESKNRDYSPEILKEKPYFANFITSHDSEYGLRSRFFEKLSEYKRVESAGSFMNNMPNGERVNWSYVEKSSKEDLQRKCKFTLCFESTKHDGFVTEKIIDAFYADTIPIYYGSDTVMEIFNKEAFINCSDYPTMDAVIERIKELDANDELYLEMLRKPILNNPNYVTEKNEGLEAYLRMIFDQPVNRAYRRSRVYSPAWTEQYLNAANTAEYITLKDFLKGRMVRYRGRVNRFRKKTEALKIILKGQKNKERIKTILQIVKRKWNRLLRVR